MICASRTKASAARCKEVEFDEEEDVAVLSSCSTAVNKSLRSCLRANLVVVVVLLLLVVVRVAAIFLESVT